MERDATESMGADDRVIVSATRGWRTPPPNPLPAIGEGEFRPQCDRVGRRWEPTGDDDVAPCDRGLKGDLLAKRCVHAGAAHLHLVFARGDDELAGGGPVAEALGAEVEINGFGFACL